MSDVEEKIEGTCEETLATKEPPYASSNIEDDGHLYRAISRAAIASVVLTGIGWALMVFNWSMLVLPVGGVIFGLIALSNIRRYPNEIVGRGLAKFGVLAGLLVFFGGIATAVVIHLTEVPDGYERISFMDLLIDEKKPALTPRLNELHEKRVFIRGYVHPGVQEYGDVKQFVLVADMGTCCFGGQPKLSDMIEVAITSEDSVKYSRRLLRLGGVFKIQPPRKAVGGLKGGFFKLEADYVK